MTELGWRFDPLEKRDLRGRWSAGGDAYHPPDPARLVLKNRAGPYYYRTPADHPFFKAHPVSAANIVAAYDDSSPQEIAQGMRWYADAHSLASKMDHGDIEQNAGVIAALSPQTGWAVNMFNADRSLDMGRALGPGEGMITGSMQHNAQEAIDGMDADEANSSSKTKAFARLIRDGGDAPDDHLGQVVIDRHAMTVALGERLPKSVADTAPIGKDRYYQYVADTYRNAALEISSRGTPIAPYQLQAITWLRQQRINEAEDEAAHETTVARGGHALSKGRATSLRNAWRRWSAEAAKHEYPLVPGTTGPITETFSNLLGVYVIELFNPAEPRGPGGEWVGFGGLAKAAEMVSPEGFSVSLHTGEEPVTGYMVAQQGHTHTFPESVLGDKKALAGAIDQMLMTERDIFGNNTNLGGWVHDGKLWLEPSDNIASRSEAERTARERDQIAIWDVNGGAEIQTGGGGGGSIIEHSNTEGDHQGARELLGLAGRPAAGDSGQAGWPDPGGIAGQLLDLSFTGWLHEERDIRGRWTHGSELPGSPASAERHGYRGKFEGYDPLVPSMQAADQRKPLDQPGRTDGLGTPDDPVDVHGDMSRAVTLMADGKHVRLNSPAEIKPLLDEVDRQATAQGYSRDHEPAWDLGNISVTGTRLFNEQTRGIARQDMPQLNGPAQPGTEAALLAGGANKFIELDPEFREQLRRDGVDVKYERVPAGNLRATQTQLTAATVAGITKAAESGNPKVRAMLKEPIWVSSDNYVIDGHHRWASDEALAFSGHGPKDIEVQRIALPIRLAVPYALAFAQQMGIGGRAIGNAKLVDSANNISTQLLDFAGWEHELRGPDGRWIKSRQQASIFSKIKHGIGQVVVLPGTAEAAAVSPYISTTGEVHADALAQAAKSAHIVPGLLGSSHEEWNGTVGVYPMGGKGKNILAELDWDGTMYLQKDVAQAISDTVHSDGPVKYPDAFEVMEHEDIHGVTPPGEAEINQKAYQTFAAAEIEEGSTELGAILHAPEFFEQMGLADRPTTHGTFTVREMAEEIRKPENIESGNTWGHYEQQVKDMQDWVQEVAKQEGITDFTPGTPGYTREIELSDEINRQGAAGKIVVMSGQMVGALLKNKTVPEADRQDLLTRVQDAIFKAWDDDPKQPRGEHAADQARAQVAEKMREMQMQGVL